MRVLRQLGLFAEPRTIICEPFFAKRHALCDYFGGRTSRGLLPSVPLTRP